MSDLLRKPLAKLEAKDERITFRVQRSVLDVLQRAAVAEGEELSRYIRSCVIAGHSLKESQKLYKATLG